MSGIAGMVRFDGAPVMAEALGKQSGRLRHRGPDGVQLWQHDNAGLVHGALGTTLEARWEHQPLVSEDGRLVITADARLDNRAELIAYLKLASALDQPAADSVLILAAYRAWGETCCEKLLGDFAFAIWDREQQLLFCARDCFGVKPFYYHAGCQMFAFGSEIGALLILEEVPRRLNEAKIASYLLEVSNDKVGTFYQDILRLAPAHYLKANSSGVLIKRYWALGPDRQLCYKAEADYTEAYRQLFVDAVQVRLRSAGPVGAMLSGGLDSSAITGVAESLVKRSRAPNLQTFSVVFDSVPQSDERTYIQMVLAAGDCAAHFIRGDLVNPISDLSSTAADEDEPMCTPQMFLNRSIWAAVQQTGVRVVLDGLMGDNVISHSFFLLNQLAREGQWLSLYRLVRSLAANHPDPAPVPKLMAQFIWQEGLKPRFPRAARRAWRTVRGQPAEAQIPMPPFLNPDFVRRTDLMEQLRAQQARRSQVRTARQQHYLELEDGLIQTALEVYSRECSRFGVEARFPFLDRRLVEFCLAIPPEQKLKHGYSRWVARAGMAGYLPEAIRWRSTKGDLGWNFIRGMQADRQRLVRLLAEDSPAAYYLNPKVVQAVGERAGAGKCSDSELMTTFLIASLVLWFNSRAHARGGTATLDRKEVSLSA